MEICGDKVDATIENSLYHLKLAVTLMRSLCDSHCAYYISLHTFVYALRRHASFESAYSNMRVDATINLKSYGLLQPLHRKISSIVARLKLKESC